MGSVLSSRSRTAPARESRGVRGTGDLSPYRYPPPHGGVYFANHYYLGHKKFDTGEPEVFLFGDLQDINYLPAKPIKFPYKQPSKNHPLKTLRSYINIQRDSIKLVRVVGSESMYSVQFTFDSDVACEIRVLTHVLDTTPVDTILQNKPFVGPFKFCAESEQVFNKSECCIDPTSLLGSPHGSYDPHAGNHTVPIALVMTTSDNGHTHMEQTQVSLCTLDRLSDQNFSIKIIKQKLLVRMGGAALWCFWHSQGFDTNKIEILRNRMRAAFPVCKAEVYEPLLLVDPCLWWTPAFGGPLPLVDPCFW